MTTPKASAEEVDNESTLYLLGGSDEERKLSLEAGTEEAIDVVEQEGVLTYKIDHVNGEYDGSGHALAELYLNAGIVPGIATSAIVSYDFDGDGEWDRTEKSEQMNTNDLDSYERFERELTIEINGQDYSDFSNGSIMIEIYPLFGSDNVEVKVNAPSDTSKIILPYTLSIGEDNGEDPGDGEDPGNGEDPGDGEDPGNGEDPDDGEDPGNGEDPGDGKDPGNGETPGDGGESGELDWQLTWEDNFEGNELDESKWNYSTGNGHAEGIPGWGNEELQFHQKENVKVEDGKLIIEGKKEAASDEYGSYEYTSGLIDTRGKFAQKYGRFEAKMKLPEGSGYWPAFWMMPEDDVYGGWAISGEIDIMEAAGHNPNVIGGALHYGGQWPNNTYTAKDYVFPEGSDNTDFNVYSIEWEPGEIRYYVNDDLYQTLNNWHATDSDGEKYAYPAPFDQEFHIIFDLSIGGWYGKQPDETTGFPGKMEVEYVRAYELPEYKEPKEPGFEVGELPSDAKEAIDGNLSLIHI